MTWPIHNGNLYTQDQGKLRCPHFLKWSQNPELQKVDLQNPGGTLARRYFCPTLYFPNIYIFIRFGQMKMSGKSTLEQMSYWAFIIRSFASIFLTDFQPHTFKEKMTNNTTWDYIATFKSGMKSRKSKAWKLMWVNLYSIGRNVFTSKKWKNKMILMIHKSRSSLSDSPPFICLVRRITLSSPDSLFMLTFVSCYFLLPRFQAVFTAYWII